jgi:hypothetical protein
MRLHSLAIIFSVIFLAGCAALDFEQNGHKARFIVSNSEAQALSRENSEVAPLYGQYAILAALAYDDSLYSIGKGSKSEIEKCEDDVKTCQHISRRLEEFYNIWSHKPIITKINDCSKELGINARRDFDHDGIAGHCAYSKPDRHRVLDGLGIQVWARKRNPCGEIVIVFRGTDFQQTDDWVSNFRWITRALPVHDQYEQVREHSQAVIRQAIRQIGCIPKSATAVGHSLGGALAQHAALSQLIEPKLPKISRVIAFNPSFVTGEYDNAIRGERLRQASQRLKIDKIYEHGEILAIPRFLLGDAFPPNPCSPHIRLIRLNLIGSAWLNYFEGKFARQHSMALYARRLLFHTASPLEAHLYKKNDLLPISNKSNPSNGECLMHEKTI